MQMPLTEKNNTPSKRSTGGSLVYKIASTALCIAAITGATSALGSDDNAPPWSDPIDSGFSFTLPKVDNVPDIHGEVNDPQLVIFFAGNQYMVVNELIREFRKEHPEYKRIMAETLPPGKLAKQIKKGSLRIGNMTLSAKPDIYTASTSRIADLQKKHGWFSDIRPYATNKLAIMTYKNNPKNIKTWHDMARSDVQVCLPNPKFEGIAENAIIPSIKSEGGDSLVDKLYHEKAEDGTAFLTQIHHRQTPMRIMNHKCDIGPVWYTEAYFHNKIAKHPLDIVKVSKKHNKSSTYAAARLESASHKQAAQAFMDFLTSDKGQAIYKKYGFSSVDKNSGA